MRQCRFNIIPYFSLYKTSNIRVFLIADVAQVFVDESGQYFYQNVDGTQQQMVVVSSDGGDASEGESGGAEGSVMLNAEEDSINEVSSHFGFIVSTVLYIKYSADAYRFLS